MTEINISKKCFVCIDRRDHQSHANCGIIAFQSQLLRWYKKNKRDYLPWRFRARHPVSAYHILVSEIMLQQTQISRVLHIFPRFIHTFPDMPSLASANLDKVLKEWQGMGYNRRALYLKQCAEQLIKKYNGTIPSDPLLLKTLPGIGPYTAGAISCFAFNKPVVFLDTNIRKLFIHYFFADYAPKQKISDTEILPIAERVLYKKNPRVWNYALMDYGARVLSRKPELLFAAKSYHKQSPFLGSTRFFRSQIIQYLLNHSSASYDELQNICPHDVSPLLVRLCREGLIKETTSHIFSISTG